MNDFFISGSDWDGVGERAGLGELIGESEMKWLIFFLSLFVIL